MCALAERVPLIRRHQLAERSWHCSFRGKRGTGAAELLHTPESSPPTGETLSVFLSKGININKLPCKTNVKTSLPSRG